MRGRNVRNGLVSGLSVDAAPAERRPDGRVQTRGPGPCFWLPAHTPRSPRARAQARLSAAFAFAFLPRVLRKMKVAVSNSRRISRRGEGRRVRGGGSGAGELGPQPTPGEVSAALSWSPRGLLLADRAGGTPGGRWARAGVAGEIGRAHV